MLIDLSIKLDNTTPTYPGDPPITLAQTSSVDADGYTLHMLTCGTHAGTHIDAPAHMLADGPTLDTLPLDNFIGTAKLVEGFSLEAARAANLQPGDIAVIYTGASEHLHEAQYFTDYPAMSLEVAEFLVDAGVKLVCVDTCSADNEDAFLVHKTLLRAGIPIAENLINVGSLRGRDFTIIALPLRLDVDAAPARIVAKVRS